MLRVVVSVAGAFHAFHLAEQLARHGALARLVTTYPPGYIGPRFGVRIPRERITSNRLQIGTELLGRMRRGAPDPTRPIRLLHDRFAARFAADAADLWVGWSGCSRRAIARANRAGLTTVVVRGSTHITEQMALLGREYDRVGLRFRAPARAVEDELAEYAEARFIQTNSRFAARSFLQQGIAADRIIHVTTGVHLDRFRPAPKADRVFRVVACGALSIRKGSHVLLEAFDTLRLPDSELLLIGATTPEIVPFLSRWAGPNVRLAGHVPQADLFRHLSQGSVFVMPSIEEGLATVQAQAMACGLPLLCTPNAGGEDFLGAAGDEGFVVAAGDAQALAERLRWLYEHPDACAEMGRRALARMQNGFTWDHYGDRIVARYRQIAAGGGPHDRAPSGDPAGPLC